MQTQLQIPQEKKIIFFILSIGVLFLWKVLLWRDMPLSSVDGPICLSPAFSILRGQWFRSEFAHDWMGYYQYPYLYAVLAAPFLTFFPGTHSPFLFTNLLLTLLSFLTYRFLSKVGRIPKITIALFLAMIWVSPYSYAQRWETLNLILMTGGLILFSNFREKLTIQNIVILSVVAALIGLVHPVGAVCFLFYLFVQAWHFEIPKRFYFLMVLLPLGFFLLGYFPVIALDPSKWYKNFFVIRFLNTDPHRFSMGPFFKYSFYHPWLILFYLYNVSKLKPTVQLFKEIALFTSAVLPLSFLGRSYYFPYLFVYIISRLPFLPAINISRPFLFFFLLSPFFTHYWPTIQQLENRKFCQTVREVIKNVTEYRSIAEKNIVWIPSEISTPLLYQPRTRYLFPEYRFFSERTIHLNRGDLILYYQPETGEELLENVEPAQRNKLVIRQIVPPVQGLLRLPFLGQKRSFSLGLWEASTA